MQMRILAVLALILAYRFMAHIPVPMAEPQLLKDAISNVIAQNSFTGFLNLLGGGALATISIMLVGLGPYITASVFMQMITKMFPKLEELSQDGGTGRQKINQWTRIITLPIAILESIGYISLLRLSVLSGSSVIADMSINQWILSVTAMTAGSMVLMWIAEIVTEKGLGNGISMIIMVGILSQMPQTIGVLWSAITTPAGNPFRVFNWFEISFLNNTATWMSLLMLVVGLVSLYLLVKINEGQRIINIDYAKRVNGNSQYGNVKSIIPIKLITAGVIPVIFAVAFLSLPTLIGQLMVANNWNAELGKHLVLWFQRQAATSNIITGYEALIYPVCYFILVVMFTYFYTSIVFNSREIAENLQKQGGFIANVRPGKQTEKYLRTIVTRLTFFGALALGIISILPFVAEHILISAGMSYLTTSISLGGTGLLIIVTGALESLRQINSRALMVSYDEYK